MTEELKFDELELTCPKCRHGWKWSAPRGVSLDQWGASLESQVCEKCGNRYSHKPSKEG